MSSLNDVARLAGVDPSTASRVLRGDPSQTVRPDTRERILKAARDLSYRPNPFARALRTRRTDMIGLVIPNTSNFAFSEVTRGIQQAALKAGRLVLLVEADSISDNLDSDEVYARLIHDGSIDGLLVAFATLEDHLVTQLSERGLPLVLVNRRTAGIRGSVVVDDEKGVLTAVRHLVELGHRRIAYIGLPRGIDTASRREDGFRSGLAEAELQPRAAWMITAPPTLSGGHDAVKQLTEEGTELPSAVVVASLRSAVAVISALNQREIRVPSDVSVIAFNDHELASETAPPLTTVRMPNFRMGTEAVNMLLNAVDGKETADVMVAEPPELIVRKSTAVPRRD